MDMILILYVDDLLLLGQDLSKIKDVKRQLGKLYQMKDLGPTSSYLGICITRDCKKRIIWIDQQVYIENALKRFELQDANNTKTLLPAGVHLEKSEQPVALDTKTYYQLPTDNQNIDLCCHRHKTRYRICSHETITI